MDGKKYMHKIIDNTELPESAKQIGHMLTDVGASPETIIHSMVDAINISNTSKAEKKFKKQAIPKNYSKIEREIAEMMMENTGVDILDSGMENGRHWQQNRLVKDFREIKPLMVNIYSEGYIDFTINVFHFLTENLEITEETKKYNLILNRMLKKADSYHDAMEDFADYLSEMGYTVNPFFNTFNNDPDLLSQDIQGFIFYDDDEFSPYITLQLHNGADIRGGYTKPRVFKIKDLDRFILSQYYIYAGCKDGYIYSDDGGYHWYSNYLEIDGYGFPKEWKFIKNKKDNYYKCSKCGRKIRFWSDLKE